MSDFKGTPGPWVMEVVDGFNTVGVASATGESICDMYHCVAGWTKPTSKQWKIDNARLIASAPDLLEALRLADAMLCGAHMNAAIVQRKVSEAIRKATANA